MERNGINKHVVIVTGKAGSGKSTVCKILEKVGFKVIDVDKIAHSLLDELKEVLIDKFGKSILSPLGNIDRKKLGEIVFRDESKMKELEEAIHPHLSDRIRKEIEGLSGNIAIDVAIPGKLGIFDLADFTIYLSVDESNLIKRLIAKGWSEEKIYSILRQQQLEQPLGRVYELSNNGDLSSLERTVLDIIKKEGLVP
ncbi:MAG: dephospho-CoA kinase [candidate division WOR-3 bacterium]